MKVTRFKALKASVANRGQPPDSFLEDLLLWGRMAPEEIFAPNPYADVYWSVAPALGPWVGNIHRRSVMLEVMRVLGGFESSWNWKEGRDVTNQSSVTADTIEAGLWQVSANAMEFGPELQDIVLLHSGSLNGWDFQRAMKEDHALAMDFIARLLRRTTKHNGPVHRHEIDRWLSIKAVAEFTTLLYEV